MKKLGTVILLLIIFGGAAWGSWNYFKNNKSTFENTPSYGQISGEASSDALDASADDAHDHGDDSEHKHDEQVGAADGMIGEKGKNFTLSVQPNLGRRGVGDPNAPVKIHEFFSLTCNHCASFHKDVYPQIKSELIDTGKVYFIYEEFPLNGPALYGSMIARCLPEARYAGFVDLLLTTQDKWAFGGDFKASLKQSAALAGMSDDAFEACFKNEELQKEIANNIKDASDAWKISSTPSFVINDGERIFRGGQPYASFKSVVMELTGETAPKAEAAPTMIKDAVDSAVEGTSEVIEDLGAKVDDLAEDVQEVIEQNTETQDVIEDEPEPSDRY